MAAAHVLGSQFYRLEDLRDLAAARPRLTIAGEVAARIARGAAGQKLLQAVDNLEHVLGIELLTAAQATAFVAGLELSSATRSIVESFRSRVPFLAADRILAGDIAAARRFVVEQAPFWRQGQGLALA